jgi:Tol biopolymer transport system component
MSAAIERLAAALADRYRIERELGAGGMATVYLADDLKHDRKVAVKVLRPELAAVIGAERFLAEIRTTAKLQHSHILPLHDSGEVRLGDSGDNGPRSFLYYVMPFVEGESLRDRLNREQQLPVAEAVRIASEVASALDYAHRHGVIHRDIKPENILLHDGSAMVADFGIALAVRSAGGTRMTETGMSLGTPHYMSPEQAMGEREITARSDVYALGAITYEMLVGEPPFTGPSAQSIVAKVLTEQPRPLAPKRHTIPPHIDATVLMALEKLPADRFASAAQFAEALSGRTEGLPVGRTYPGTSAALPPGRLAASWRRNFWIAASVATACLGVAAWSWMRGRSSPAPISRQYITAGNGMAIYTGAPSLALSPDGSVLAFVDTTPDGPIFLKHRADLNPVAIPGTGGANNPTFSPDGKWIAYMVSGHLRKVAIAGGSPINLSDSAGAGFFAGVAWLEDNSLVYVTTSLTQLRRMSADGGASTLVATTEDSALAGRGAGVPVALPGNHGVLFKVCTSGCVTMDLYASDLKGHQKLLIPGAAMAWYLGDGRLLYVQRDGAALIAPFDLDRLELTGPGVPSLNGVLVTTGYPNLTWSKSGTLVYLEGTGNGSDAEVLRVTRSGVVSRIDTAWFGAFNSLALSPDGGRVAIGMGSGDGLLNIWIKQLDRGPFSRLTFSGRDRRPAWSPDGRMVAFVRDTVGGLVMGHASDGSGPDVPLARLDQLIQEIDWSPDGRWIIGRTDNSAAGAGDLVAFRPGGDTAPMPIAPTPYTELHPSLSPDGHWLAYASNESGVSEVYVRPFPNSGSGRWQVSLSGGSMPRWSRNGRELYFVSSTNRMMAATITTRPAFGAGTPVALFNVAGFTLDAFHPSYDVLPNGDFLMIGTHHSGADTGPPRIVWVDNWLSDLKARRFQ